MATQRTAPIHPTLLSAERELFRAGLSKSAADFARAIERGEGMLEISLRDLTATGGTNGSEGGVFASGGRVNSALPILAERPILRVAGATFLDIPGDVPRLGVPVADAFSASVFRGETEPLAEVSPSFAGKELVPHRAGLHAHIATQLVAQSPALEAWLSGELVAALDREVDRACLAGSGVDGSPAGILVDPAVPSDTAFNFASASSWLSAIEAVAVNTKALAGMAIVLSPRAWSLAAQGSAAATHAFLDHTAGRLCGVPFVLSALVPELPGVVKPALACALLGRMSDLWVARWDNVALSVNPFIRDVEGVRRVVAEVFTDCATVRPASFRKLIEADTES